MDRTGVFVDAGYLFAAGSKLLANEKLPRAELKLDYDAVVRFFGALAGELTGLPLLRIYWYDGTATGPTAQHLALAYKPNLKLRLGFINHQGQQKGVDSLVITDLINLARNRAMSDALVVSGDDDIRLGVQQAQEFGIRVHLVGIAPARENQSGLLAQEADGLRELSLEEVASFLSRASSEPAGPAAVGEELAYAGLDAIAQLIASELTADEAGAVHRDLAGSVPAPIDRRLLALAFEQAGAALSPEQKRHLRKAFRQACDRESPPAAPLPRTAPDETCGQP